MKENAYLCGMGIQDKIAKAIVTKREELGMSRYELEKRSGIAYNHLTKIEKGETSITMRLLDKLLNVLNLEMIIVDKD